MNFDVTSSNDEQIYHQISLFHEYLQLLDMSTVMTLSFPPHFTQLLMLHFLCRSADELNSGSPPSGIGLQPGQAVVVWGSLGTAGNTEECTVVSEY